MAIRIDLSQDQDVEVTATFEVCDEVPDGVTADDAEDILELMDNSHITMAEVIEAALLNGVDMPESHSVTFDSVMAFLSSGNADTGQLMRLIDVSVNELFRHIRMVEKTNEALRDKIDRLSAVDQKTA